MDINKASAEELEHAFQVDGTRAQYLVEQREHSGAFKSWDDVKQVPGFEDKMVENLQAAGLTIGTGESTGNRTSQERNTDTSGGETHERGINLNSASAEQLERAAQLDGMRAHYLIDARNRLGGFQSWDDVKREVPSFEDGMIENLKKAGIRI